MVEIQNNMIDADKSGKIEKSEFLDGLEKLQAQDVINSLNNPETSKDIMDIIIDPLNSFLDEFWYTSTENLNNDQKDALVLSARLNNPDIDLSSIEEYQTIAINELKRLQEGVDPKYIENIQLIQESDKIIESIAENKSQFESIVYLLSYFNNQPKGGFSISIINNEILKLNGRDKLNGSLNFNNLQKREIVKSFLTIPSDLLPILLDQFNNSPINKDKQILLSEFEKTEKYYKTTQSKIDTNKISIISRRQTNIINPGNQELPPDFKESQKIGELFELPEYEKNIIRDKLNNIKDKYDEINISAIRLTGEADATPVSPNGKKKIEENFNKHITLLKENGMNISGLPEGYSQLGKRLISKNKIKFGEESNADIIANWGFAITRAIMQISWMSKEESQILSKTKIDVINGLKISEKKGDKYTLGGVYFEGSGSLKGETTPPKIFQISNMPAEILLKNSVQFAIKVGDETRIFNFSKEDLLSGGTLNNSTLSQEIFNPKGGTQGYASQTTRLEQMKELKTREFTGDGNQVFLLNIPENDSNNPTISKIKDIFENENGDIPSVEELIDLYESLGGTTKYTRETDKFKVLYSL